MVREDVCTVWFCWNPIPNVNAVNRVCEKWERYIRTSSQVSWSVKESFHFSMIFVFVWIGSDSIEDRFWFDSWWSSSDVGRCGHLRVRTGHSDFEMEVSVLVRVCSRNESHTHGRWIFIGVCDESFQCVGILPVHTCTEWISYLYSVLVNKHGAGNGRYARNV